MNNIVGHKILYNNGHEIFLCIFHISGDFLKKSLGHSNLTAILAIFEILASNYIFCLYMYRFVRVMCLGTRKKHFLATFFIISTYTIEWFCWRCTRVMCSSTWKNHYLFEQFFKQIIIFTALCPNFIMGCR